MCVSDFTPLVYLVCLCVIHSRVLNVVKAKSGQAKH